MLATQDGFHADDKSQVEKACGQTSHPDVCVSCVNSDPNRSTSEILFCMMSEATHGHEVVDPQTETDLESANEDALQHHKAFLKLCITQEGVRSPFSSKLSDRPVPNATLQVTGVVGRKGEGEYD
ncbi:AP-2 complex subunit mu [Vitis vinifera]|uniref:AP-2 complex subunit mu n=1 Tax=Vitis vinifera TaxID=29760 RepID=A0A438GC08_VITVI|nr:AP-2 complex subunit mu [Vitis vinifera]